MNKCPACGFENNPGEKVCGGCGKPLGKPFAMRAYLLAGILLVMSGVFLAVKMKEYYSPSTPPAPVSATAQAPSPATVSSTALEPVNAAASATVPQSPQSVTALQTALPSGSTVSADTSMALIRAGEFAMGSDDGRKDEKPLHRVRIDAFYMDKYEVTFEQYDRFCDATGRKKSKDAGWGRGNRPVINATWDDAKAYSEWAGKRLPTEAEWEYACRAGSKEKWCYGNNEARLVEYAWYSANSGNMTHPVGRKKANAWGLYDMHGGVWEWCSDWYGENYYASSGKRNPRGAARGKLRVLRGGSWGIVAGFCRSSSRSGVEPGYTNINIGFRCASSVKNGS